MPLINCKKELILSWSKNCIISEILRTAEEPVNPPNPAEAEMPISDALFQINSAKPYIPAATLFINNNIYVLRKSEARI